jgi:hypothetical protein
VEKETSEGVRNNNTAAAVHPLYFTNPIHPNSHHFSLFHNETRVYTLLGNISFKSKSLIALFVSSRKTNVIHRVSLQYLLHRKTERRRVIIVREPSHPSIHPPSSFKAHISSHRSIEYGKPKPLATPRTAAVANTGTGIRTGRFVL